MKINRIHIDAFGGLNDFLLDFTNGFQVIAAENEFGKSTVMAFIKMMFYGKGNSSRDIRKNDRTKYRPWDNSHMGGVMEFSAGGREYRLEKQFGKSFAGDKVTLYCISTGEQVAVGKDEEVGKLLLNMERSTFEKVIYIGNDITFSVNPDEDEIAEKIAGAVQTDDSESVQKAIVEIRDAMEDLVSKSGRTGRLVELRKEYNEMLMKADEAAKTEENNKQYRDKYNRLQNAMEAKNIKENIERLQEMIDDMDLSESYYYERPYSKLLVPGIAVMAAGIILFCLSYKIGIALAVLGILAVIFSFKTNKVCEEKDSSLCEKWKRKQMEYKELLNEFNSERRYLEMSSEELKDEIQMTMGNIRVVDVNPDCLYEAVREMKKKLKAMEDYYKSLCVAMEAMQQIEMQYRVQFHPELNRITSDIFRKITGGRYQSVIVQKDYSASVVEEERVTSRDWKYLSKGTCDQLYLSIRIAIAQQLGEDENYPLFLDDVLESYDDERLEYALEFLKEYGSDRQVVMFTCHGQMKKLANAGNEVK